MDKAMNYLGIARKAGKVAAGEDAVGASVHAGRARLILLASDASPNAVKRAHAYVSGRRTVLLELSLTKEELSGVIGSPLCAMAAVTDIGLAASIAKALSGSGDESPDEYKKAAETLSVRNAKAIRRKKQPAGKKLKSEKPPDKQSTRTTGKEPIAKQSTGKQLKGKESTGKQSTGKRRTRYE